jgi:hypothetical protein
MCSRPPNCCTQGNGLPYSESGYSASLWFCGMTFSSRIVVADGIPQVVDRLGINSAHLGPYQSSFERCSWWTYLSCSRPPPGRPSIANDVHPCNGGVECPHLQSRFTGTVVAIGCLLHHTPSISLRGWFDLLSLRQLGICSWCAPCCLCLRRRLGWAATSPSARWHQSVARKIIWPLWWWNSPVS